MYSKDFEVIQGDNGNSMLVTKETVVLTEELLRMKISQAELDKRNMIKQAKKLQERYDELTTLIDLYNKELNKIKKEEKGEVDDIFNLE